MNENYDLSPPVVQQRSAGVKHSLDQAAALKRARKVRTMNEDSSPIADTITLVANGQAGEATPIVHDLLGARVLDALQSHKQEIAQTLFAPSADSLTEETEQLDELSKGTLGNYVKKASHRAADKAYETGYQGGKKSSTGFGDVSGEIKRHRGIRRAVDKLVKK